MKNGNQQPSSFDRFMLRGGSSSKSSSSSKDSSSIDMAEALGMAPHHMSDAYGDQAAVDEQQNPDANSESSTSDGTKIKAMIKGGDSSSSTPTALKRLQGNNPADPASSSASSKASKSDSSSGSKSSSTSSGSSKSSSSSGDSSSKSSGGSSSRSMPFAMGATPTAPARPNANFRLKK